MAKKKGTVKLSRNNFSDKGFKRIERISKVAARLFNNVGYIETNIDDIAGAARISKGGIYHYFSSKDEILFFMLTKYMDIILHDLDKDLEEIQDPSSKIRFIISRHIRLFTEHVHEAKTLLHDAHCLPDRLYNVIAAKERNYYRMVADAVTEFLGGEEVLGNARVTVIVYTLFGMCNWIYSWYDPKGEIGPEELSEIIWTLFLKGVRELRN